MTPPKSTTVGASSLNAGALGHGSRVEVRRATSDSTIEFHFRTSQPATNYAIDVPPDFAEEFAQAVLLQVRWLREDLKLKQTERAAKAAEPKIVQWARTPDDCFRCGSTEMTLIDGMRAWRCYRCGATWPTKGNEP